MSVQLRLESPFTLTRNRCSRSLEYTLNSYRVTRTRKDNEKVRSTKRPAPRQPPSPKAEKPKSVRRKPIHAIARDIRIEHGPTKAILMLLASHADRDLKCWPSVRSLIWNSGFGRTTVLESLRRLEARNLITIQRRQRQSSIYRLCLENLKGHVAAPLKDRKADPEVTSLKGGASYSGLVSNPDRDHVGVEKEVVRTTSNHAPSSPSQGKKPSTWDSSSFSPKSKSPKHTLTPRPAHSEKAATIYKEVWRTIFTGGAFVVGEIKPWTKDKLGEVLEDLGPEELKTRVERYFDFLTDDPRDDEQGGLIYPQREPEDKGVTRFVQTVNNYGSMAWSHYQKERLAEELSCP